MIWLFILLVMAVAFGPIIWLRPSRRERRIAALRETARKAGVDVALAEIDHPDPTAQQQVSAGGARKRPMLACVAYRLPVKHPNADLAPLALAVRGERERRPGPAPGWRYREPPTFAGAGLNVEGAPPDPSPTNYWQRLPELLARLPDDVVGVHWRRGIVIAYWLEGAGEGRFEQLAETLRDLAALQIEVIETRLATVTPGEDE